MNDCFTLISTDNDEIAYTPVVNLFPRETFSSSFDTLARAYPIIRQRVLANKREITGHSHGNIRARETAYN